MKLIPEILTHPNIPKPLHGVNPRSIMGEIEWGLIKTETYKKYGYRCAACGVHVHQARFHKRLEAHENYEIDYFNGRVMIKSIEPLCHCCHQFIHSGFLSISFKNGNVSKGFVKFVLQHGINILNKHGLKIFPYTGELAKSFGCINIPEGYAVSNFGAEWSKWRLVYEGKEYPPIHKSFGDWETFYSNEN